MIPDGSHRVYSDVVHSWWWLIIAPVALVIGLVVVLLSVMRASDIRTADEQAVIAPFYDPPTPLPSTPA